MNTASHADTVTFLFTDIEGSTRLWEEEPERMPPALARHDALTCGAVEGHGGTVVKMTGDGVCAAFADAGDALGAVLELQQALADPAATNGVPLQVRCGLHLGVVERRDRDFFGSAVNRAARIMGAAHGGQVLLSQAVAEGVRARLPAAVALRDLGAVRLKDLARPEHVYQVVHPALRQDFPALRSLAATPNNLPQQVSSFVGREREQVELAGLLAQTRLLTLVGVGGLGKTRLSLQVAAEVLDDYADGVWFVELAPLSDARLVAQAVASVLGVKEEPGRPVVEALVKNVGDRQLLLLLDNCEHLLLACADLAKQLLHAGPKVRVLASSREPLHIGGETIYPLPPLSIPDSRRPLPPEALTRFEAVRLFVDRAVAAQPAFQVTPDNAPAVTAICHTLDGIPLAIELAAARVRTLSVATIAERLSDRFRLLTGGDQSALPRQQTLRACIDWSYDLLSESERALLRRLAVFAGGWTLDAAEAVGAGGDIAASDVLDLLTRLVEKSLVELEAAGERYRLLETLRQYALARLEDSSEERETRTQHLAFYVALAEKAKPKLGGPEQAAWYARLDLEYENLLAAHTWCDRVEDGALPGLRLAHSMELYWSRSGILEVGLRVTVHALTRTGAQARSVARCQALAAAGNLSFYLGRFREAQECGEESLSIARELSDKNRVVGALVLVGWASHALGDLLTARRSDEEALALARDLGDKGPLDLALNNLAELYRADGDLDAAEPLYEEAVAFARACGDGHDVAVNLFNLAMVSIGRGSIDRARGMLLEAISIVDEINSKRLRRAALEVAASLAVSLRQWEHTARFYGAAQAQLEQMGLHREPADEASLAPLIAKARHALGDTAFANAEAAGRALRYDEAMAEARAWLDAGQ